MPTSVLIGVVCLLLALIMYSIGVWTAFRKKGFGTTQVVSLWLGVAFDVAATVSMGSTVGGLDLSAKGWLHTTLALVVMLGMVLAASFGTAAMVKKDERLGATCAKYNIIAWVLWVAVFVWGMATRMPAR